MMRGVKKHVAEQPRSGNRTKKRSINWFQPIRFRAAFHEVLKHFVSSLNQFSAMAYIIMPADVDFAHRRVFHIRWYAKKLTE